MTRVRQRRYPLSCEGLETRKLLSSGYYYVVNAARGKVLDDPGFSTMNGEYLQQFQLNGGSNQRWYLDPQVVGTTIKNAYSGKVLEDPGFKRTSTEIQQNDWKMESSQQWAFVKLPDNNYKIVNCYSGLVMDDPSGSVANQTHIQQYPWNGGYNQQWILIGAGSGPVHENFVSNMAGGMQLDEPAGTTANNATLVRQEHRTGLANQEWIFIPLADGNQMIVNAASGLALDDPGFSGQNGTPIQVYQVNGGLNQQWQVIREGSNHNVANYTIENAYSGLVLTDPGGSTQDGEFVIQYTWLFNIPSQLWILS
jgi:hypothetical protein